MYACERGSMVRLLRARPRQNLATLATLRRHNGHMFSAASWRSNRTELRPYLAIAGLSWRWRIQLLLQSKQRVLHVFEPPNQRGVLSPPLFGKLAETKAGSLEAEPAPCLSVCTQYTTACNTARQDTDLRSAKRVL